VGSGAISPDGRTAAIATGRDTITMYQLPALTPERTITIDLKSANADRVYVSPQVFLPDGRLLVSGNDPGPPPDAPASAPKPNAILALASPTNGAVYDEVGMGVEGNLDAVAWSADGTKIVAGTNGGKLWLLRASDLHPLVANVPAVSGFLLTATFSPDGSMVVAAGTDGTVSFFDASSLHRIGNPIRMPYPDWTFAAYDPHRAVVMGLAPVRARKTRAFTFPGSPDTWARVACHIAGSDLTRAEWHRYAGTVPYQPVCQS
jgi:WD40 repeat protein